MNKQIVACIFIALTAAAHAQTDIQTDRPIGSLEVVASVEEGAMPTGVTVSHGGRIFLNFPQWGDHPVSAVAEWKDGKLLPYDPPLSAQPSEPKDRLIGVQSVVVDQKDNLWILDTGSIEFGPSEYGGPKLVQVDLSTNKVVRTILFPRDVAPSTSFLNDVRFDYSHGKAGYALITDTSAVSNGIVIADLATGKSWRHLTDHPTTKPEKGFQPFVEGEALLVRPKDGPTSHLTFGSDGIAISPQYDFLYYSSVMGRHLYQVPLALLENASTPEKTVGAAVKDLGDKGMSDGLESDAEGRIYGGDMETNSIRRRLPDGTLETLAHDPRILWADTLSLANDGYLYFTANQLNRQGGFHRGVDGRKHPYMVFRIKVDAKQIQ